MSDLDSRVTALEDWRRIIESDIAEMRVTLSQMATKSDLSSLETRLTALFQSGHIDVLKGALNSVPGRQMAIWSAITAIIAIIALALQFHH